jgi:UDP-N-acetylglucosamine 4,6-dehydratase
LLFKGKKVLITGGTGSLGTALTKKILDTDVDTIRIFSRDELKQVQMKERFEDSRIRFLIGDVRDKERLFKALEDIDIVIHTAAMKQVPVVEYNPFEAVKTNIHGTQNLIECCFSRDVETVLGIGTDKAVSPFNTYGATKFLMERLFLSSNYYKGEHKTKFFCVRYGNVMGSRGSVIPLFIDQIKKYGKITVTDSSMTRFNITMNDALALIFRAIQYGNGGEVFVPKLKAYSLGDLIDVIVDVMGKKISLETIPVRPGEKFHESLISADEIRNTYETDTDYIVFEKLTQERDILHDGRIRNSTLKDRYSSDKVTLLTKQEIKNLILAEGFV